MRVLGVALFSAIVFAACESAFFPPPGTQYEPPLRYHTLWRTVETCSGLAGDFADVTWYVTSQSPAGVGEVDAAGAWWKDFNRIYIKAPFFDNDQVIRHEMLHAVLQKNGHGPVFLGACGGLVLCEVDCELSAGGLAPLPTAASDTILPAQLDVTISVIAPEVGDGGWTTIVVVARNPLNEPVWVDLGGRPGVQFECLVAGVPCATIDSTGAAHAPFRAGETRRSAAVFRVTTPGSYEIIGAFNNKQSASDTLVVP
jgi:hypothetical protein